MAAAYGKSGRRGQYSAIARAYARGLISITTFKKAQVLLLRLIIEARERNSV